MENMRIAFNSKDWLKIILELLRLIPRKGGR